MIHIFSPDDKGIHLVNSDDLDIIRYINLVYCAFTIPTMFLVCLSFKKNYQFKNTLYPAFVLMLFRQLIRLADIEGNKKSLDPDIWNNKENF